MNIVMYENVIISIFLLVSIQFMIISIAPSGYLVYSTSSNEGITAKVFDTNLKVKLYQYWPGSAHLYVISRFG